MRREDLTNHLTLRKQEINFFGYEWISIEEAKMNEENSNIIVSGLLEKAFDLVIIESEDEISESEDEFGDEMNDSGDENEPENEEDQVGFETGLYEEAPDEVLSLTGSYGKVITKMRKIINRYAGKSTVRNDSLQVAIKEWQKQKVSQIQYLLSTKQCLVDSKFFKINFIFFIQIMFFFCFRIQKRSQWAEN